MGFSRQEYLSVLPCPPPGDLPNPGTEPRSPTLQADSLLSEPPGKSTAKRTSCKAEKHPGSQRDAPGVSWVKSVSTWLNTRGWYPFTGLYESLPGATLTALNLTRCLIKDSGTFQRVVLQQQLWKWLICCCSIYRKSPIYKCIPF